MASSRASRTVILTVLPFHSVSAAGGGDVGAGRAAFFSSEGLAAVGACWAFGAAGGGARGGRFSAVATPPPFSPRGDGAGLGGAPPPPLSPPTFGAPAPSAPFASPVAHS